MMASVDVSAYHRGLHVPDNGLLPRNDRCPICGGSDRRSLFDVQTDPTVTLLECLRCRAASVSRLPTPDSLSDYYGHYYDNNPAGVTAGNPQLLARRIVGYLAGRPLPSGSGYRILDFGGGNGSVAKHIAERLSPQTGTVQVTVVDYDTNPVAQSTAPNVTLTRVPDLNGLDAGITFDLVLAGAVLEHLSQPADVLSRLLDRVNPQGMFYARTPYVVPVINLSRRAGRPVDFTFPAHLHDMGPQFWNSITSWMTSAQRFDLIGSRPSPVETGRDEPVRTVAAWVLKAPWRLLGERWKLVGGWEAALGANDSTRV